MGKIQTLTWEWVLLQYWRRATLQTTASNNSGKAQRKLNFNNCHPEQREPKSTASQVTAINVDESTELPILHNVCKNITSSMITSTNPDAVHHSASNNNMVTATTGLCSCSEKRLSRWNTMVMPKSNIGITCPLPHKCWRLNDCYKRTVASSLRQRSLSENTILSQLLKY